MFCENCGTKNDNNSKFCYSCGSKLKAEERLNDKIKKIPKKAKITIITSLLFIIILIFILSILLNNPTKKVENLLTDYYTNYSEKYESIELIQIGKILKKNKDKKDTLESIKKQSNKTINNWVKNFNKHYRNKEELSSQYQKVDGALDAIYMYYKGLDYMLDKESYLKYKEEISNLYESKKNYFKSLEYSENDYQKYYYSQKVIEMDSYYNEAQSTINKFVSDEMNILKEKVENTIIEAESSNDKEKYEIYKEAIIFLKDNSYSNNLDLSNCSEYKKLMNEYSDEMVSNFKTYLETLVNNGDIKKAYELIEVQKTLFDKESKSYKELEELQEEYNRKLPTSLLKMYRVSTSGYISVTKFQTEINDKTYDGALKYRFSGKDAHITYRTNKEYARLKCKLIIGSNWDKDFKVTIKISGDGKELYKIENITKETKIEEIVDLDVKDIDDIKIEFLSSNGEFISSSGSRYFYLVEPYLYK